MPPSSLHRHPREEAKLGTNKYKILFVVVGSGFSIKRPVIVDTAIRIDYFPAGAALLLPYTLVSPGLVHLIQACPTKGVRYAEVHPSSSKERPSAGLLLSTKELWTPVLCTPARCVAGR